MIARAVTIAIVLTFGGGCAATQVANTDMRRDAAIRAEIEALLVQWSERDGELRFLISDRLALALIANPTSFMTVMSEQPAVFSDWVKNVGGASLRDHGDPLINRETLRQEMMKAARRAAPAASSATEARDILLKKLEDTPVTVVD